jgi:hypothetical protein
MDSRASTIIRLAVGDAPGDAAGDLSSSMARSDLVQHVCVPPPPDVTYSTAAVTVPATATDSTTAGETTVGPIADGPTPMPGAIAGQRLPLDRHVTASEPLGTHDGCIPDMEAFAESNFSQKEVEEDKATPRTVGFELVAFESQLLARPHMEVSMADPMRFESQVPTPTMMRPVSGPPLSSAMATPYRTYQRRHRSDASRQVADAALLPCTSPSSVRLLSQELAPAASTARG